MDKQNFVRLSISEAAKLFGVNPQTVRRAIKSGDLAYITVQGRYKINFENLVAWSQRQGTVRNKTAKVGIGQFVDKWKIKENVQPAIKQRKAGANDSKGSLINPQLPL